MWARPNGIQPGSGDMPMASSFARRFIVEVFVTEVTQPVRGGSKISREPPMSGKNKSREGSMSVGDAPIPEPKSEEPAEKAETGEDMFTRSIDGFSPGILGHPKL